MMRLSWVLVLSVLCFCQTAEDVALKAGTTIRSFRSLQTDFEQIYYSSTVSAPLKEKGRFLLMKPDLMKWEYREPEKKFFLYKNQLFQYYIPEDNQLVRRSLPDGSYESEILSLLSGTQGLLENYSVEFSPFPTDNPKSFQIKLTPKEEEADTFILLEIENKSWLIQKAIFFDWAGNKTEFRFSRIKTNVTFPRDTFELKVPSGVEIIEDIKNR